MDPDLRRPRSRPRNLAEREGLRRFRPGEPGTFQILVQPHLPGLLALGSEKVSKKSTKYESDIKTQALALHIAMFNFSKTFWLGHVDAFHLSQAGYAGMNIKDVPLAPFRYQFRLRGQAGPRTDKAHIAA